MAEEASGDEQLSEAAGVRSIARADSFCQHRKKSDRPRASLEGVRQGGLFGAVGVGSRVASGPTVPPGFAAAALCDQPELPRSGDGLCEVGRTELSQHVADVLLD